MAMKRCPVCGEKYSDTYKNCPFCEEEEAQKNGSQIRRGMGRSGKRAVKSRQPNLLSPILIVLIVIMVALLVYLLFGDQIAGRLSGCKTVKYAFLPLRRQIQPGQVAGQLIRLEHLIHNSGVILHIAHRIAIEDQAVAIINCEADQNHITSLQGERLTSAGSWPGRERRLSAPAAPGASARRRR